MYSPSDDLMDAETRFAAIASFLEQIHNASPEDRLLIQQYLDQLIEQAEVEEDEAEESPYTKRPCPAKSLSTAFPHLNTEEYCQVLDCLIESPQFKNLPPSRQQRFLDKLASQVTHEPELPAMVMTIEIVNEVELIRVPQKTRKG